MERYYVPIDIPLLSSPDPRRDLCQLVTRSIELTGLSHEQSCRWCRGYNTAEDAADDKEENCRWFGHERDCPAFIVYDYLTKTKAIKGP